MNGVGDVYLEADALVLVDLRIRVLPQTRPFRVPCMTPAAYGTVLYRPYRTVRQCCWYHSVDWQEATTVAGEVLRRALATSAGKGLRPTRGAAVDQHLPRGCSGRLREAVASLAWRQPIIASTEQITSGTHRLTAMRHQGVKSTPALIQARAGQRLADLPGVYPDQHFRGSRSADR